MCHGVHSGPSIAPQVHGRMATCGAQAGWPRGPRSAAAHRRSPLTFVSAAANLVGSEGTSNRPYERRAHFAAIGIRHVACDETVRALYLWERASHESETWRSRRRDFGHRLRAGAVRTGVRRRRGARPCFRLGEQLVPTHSLVLAIEPDLRQAAIVKRIVREKVGAEVTVVDSRDAAIEAMRTAVPDVLLISALLSPRDEDD